MLWPELSEKKTDTLKVSRKNRAYQNLTFLATCQIKSYYWYHTKMVFSQETLDRGHCQVIL